MIWAAAWCCVFVHMCIMATTLLQAKAVAVYASFAAAAYFRLQDIAPQSDVVAPAAAYPVSI